MEGISILREVMITILVPILLKFMELNFTEDVKRVLATLIFKSYDKFFNTEFSTFRRSHLLVYPLQNFNG